LLLFFYSIFASFFYLPLKGPHADAIQIQSELTHKYYPIFVKVQEFARSRKKLRSLPATNASLATIGDNIKWIEKHEKIVNDFLTEHVDNWQQDVHIH